MSFCILPSDKTDSNNHCRMKCYENVPESVLNIAKGESLVRVRNRLFNTVMQIVLE